ncbi:MAG TPA: hypothetical protein VLY24_03040 [Bryobacteraceae bacterium]|nr:hypothetical protein [Bryobacteraceae bacterium]
MKKNTAHRGLCVAGFLLASSVAQAQTSNISQIVDGGPWFSTIVVTNTSGSQASAGLNFYQETGGGATSPWSLDFMEMTSAQAKALMIPAGTTVFLHTFGTAANTTVGWGQLTEVDNAGSVVAYAIFTQRVPGRTDQEGTAPAAAASSRILVPFDNTGGAATSMAIANTTSSSLTVNVGIRTSSATTQPSSIVLPAQGHTSFSFPTQFAASAGASGLAEFYAPSGSFSILALKFEAGAFSTAPVYAETGSPIIASSGAGGGGNPQANYDGNYSGTYSGTAGSGAVGASINNGAVTVTVPASGTGTITSTGQITFGVVIGGGTTCNFTGSIEVSGASATGSGMFSCTSPTITGTWNVTRTLVMGN